MLSNIAILIAAVAGLVGSLTSFVGMVVVVRRSSPKERRDAAAGAAEKVLMPQHPILDFANTVVELKDTEEVHDDRHGKRRNRRK